MNLLVLEHASFEEPGYIGDYARERGIPMTEVRLYLQERPPIPDPKDILIIMGGPMSISEEEEYPWLRAEKEYIRSCISSGHTVLGICLGSQLVAEQLGGKVTRATVPEFGWQIVQKTEASLSYLPEIFPEQLDVFQWHGDTFTIPPKAEHLYTGKVCKNQAFISGDRVIGIQFHPEMTETSIRTFLYHEAGNPVFSEERELAVMIERNLHHCRKGHQFIISLMDHLIRISHSGKDQ